MPDNDEQRVVTTPVESNEQDEPDVVLEIDELGSLVIDLRTAYDHPADAVVAARHLELMLEVFGTPTPSDESTAD